MHEKDAFMEIFVFKDIFLRTIIAISRRKVLLQILKTCIGSPKIDRSLAMHW